MALDRENPSAKEASEYASYPKLPKNGSGALIDFVVDGSAASSLGIASGMRLISIDDVAIDDLLDWMWLSDEVEFDASFLDLDGNPLDIHMQRSADEAWGISFADNVFDGVRVCKNACKFCFMSMLPKGMRPSLYLRDDDYRLSFLQGNFITLTNITDDELERIIAMDLSPLHVSLHALDEDARLALMGRNQHRGLEVLYELVEAGIEIHTQIVLCPGYNDGDVLAETLRWVLETPEVLSIGIVPVGYTRYQTQFESSYEIAARALEIVEQVEPLQQESIERFGYSKIQLADEFYVSAYRDDIASHLPPEEVYDGYPQFYDGIGMLRSFVNEWCEAIEELDGANDGKHVIMVAGQAFKRFFEQVAGGSCVANKLTVLGVDNVFFGGNVDVNGLLTGKDVIDAIKSFDFEAQGLNPSECTVLLPQVMFNDDGLTLDDMTSIEIERAVSMPVDVICYFARQIIEAL